MIEDSTLNKSIVPLAHFLVDCCHDLEVLRWSDWALTTIGLSARLLLRPAGRHQGMHTFALMVRVAFLQRLLSLRLS